MKQRLALLFILFLLEGCASFGKNAKQLETLQDVGTRRASKAEEKILDQCLYLLFKKQQHYFEKFGHYIQKLSHLNMRKNCHQSIQLTLSTSEDSYLATAKIKTKSYIVKWTLSHKGEVIEHDDFSFDFQL